ncbi:uncharacterized protein LOC130391378 [Gadus chalcogrammus]|uniref:uncharacterized protein LOC130391378 n=1 Tax=Gadus chalcogrammus TaxID=1042646 RepID=UPI0024C21026|nr:uncharacterized protein LOC130391378 [Gadus chalcogrammus]
MKGRHNSVITKLKAKQPHIQDVGCVCHLAQLATGCGIKAMKAPVEQLLVGVYSHFDKSAKRNELYKEFVEFTDTDKLKLLRYCSTRWLSLHTCILRMLNQWPALQAYFNSYEDETSVKVRDLAGYLNDPEIKFDFLFLSAALKPLVAFNTAFQARAFLEKEELPSVTMTKIYQTVKGFYVEAIRKMLKAFPLDSPLLQDLDVLDPASRLDLSPETG